MNKYKSRVSKSILSIVAAAIVAVIGFAVLESVRLWLRGHILGVLLVIVPLIILLLRGLLTHSLKRPSEAYDQGAKSAGARIEDPLERIKGALEVDADEFPFKETLVTQPGDWATVEIFYATDRAENLGSGFVPFSADRSRNGELSFGSCKVSIPAQHRIGKLESPTIFKLQFVPDPKKHITLLELNIEPADATLNRISRKVAESGNREAFVFIHGYNVSFADAARRTAQIAYDLSFDGAPIFYSWPSAGKLLAYVKDENNVEWTIPHLRRFLIELAERSGAETIHLIAHSMGNRALARVLENWGLNGEPAAPFRHVVLTAPDIDASTFHALAKAMCSKAGKITLYSSHLDKALIASKKFHGYPRAGEIVVIVNGIDTIDASAVNTSFLGHSHFGESRSVIEDIYWLFRNQPPDQRFGITRKQRPEGVYYVFKP